MIVAIHSEPSPRFTKLRLHLEGEGHVVRSLTDATAAFDERAGAPPDLAIVQHRPGTPALAKVVGAVRAHAEEGFCYVLAVVPRQSGEDVDGALAAGADNVVGEDCLDVELVARLRSVERIVHLERCLQERVIELESALRRLELAAVSRGNALVAKLPQPADPTSRNVLLTQSWTSLEKILSKMCSEYLNSEFAAVAGATPPKRGTVGASIALTDVEHEVQIDLSLFVPPEHTTPIAGLFCGDPSIVDEAVVKDVLLELANSGMGAIKAAFLAEGFKFAGSVPRAFVFEDTKPLVIDAEAKRVMAFRCAAGTVHGFATLRRKKRTRVAAAALKEGMVLATDITSDKGLLLARAGTRLTKTAAEKLARLIPSQQIELADAAA